MAEEDTISFTPKERENARAILASAWPHLSPEDREAVLDDIISAVNEPRFVRFNPNSVVRGLAGLLSETRGVLTRKRIGDLLRMILDELSRAAQEAVEEGR